MRRHTIKCVPNDGILIPKLIEILSFLEEDISSILEETSGEFGISGDLFIEDAKLAEDLIDDMVVGKLNLELLGCIACE